MRFESLRIHHNVGENDKERRTLGFYALNTHNDDGSMDASCWVLSADTIKRSHRWQSCHTGL